MMINSVGANSGIKSSAVNGSRFVDNESTNLKNQLTVKQQNLKKVSSDSRMSEEEKAKEYREIQKQIDELNRKINRKKLEEKAEELKETKEQEKKQIMREEQLAEMVSKDKEEKNVGRYPKEEKEELEDISLPVASIKQFLAADDAMTQAGVYESVERRKAGAENVLKAEIQSDTLYGMDTEAKRKELSQMRKQENMEIPVNSKEKEANPLRMNPEVKTIIRE